MAIHLIVKHMFEGKHVGQRIEDPNEVEAILNSKFEHHVLKVLAPDPEPETTKLETIADDTAK